MQYFPKMKSKVEIHNEDFTDITRPIFNNNFDFEALFIF